VRENSVSETVQASFKNHICDKKLSFSRKENAMTEHALTFDGSHRNCKLSENRLHAIASLNVHFLDS
jgi:hypothetical protein